MHLHRHAMRHGMPHHTLAGVAVQAVVHHVLQHLAELDEAPLAEAAVHDAQRRIEEVRVDRATAVEPPRRPADQVMAEAVGDLHALGVLKNLAGVPAVAPDHETQVRVAAVQDRQEVVEEALATAAVGADVRDVNVRVDPASPHSVMPPRRP